MSDPVQGRDEATAIGLIIVGPQARECGVLSSAVGASRKPPPVE